MINFDSLATQTILQINDDIENSDTNYLVELEYEQGVLKIITHKGIYIINKHKPSEEIWLSSPISGPNHFKHQNDTNQWLNKKKHNILEILSSEMMQIASLEINWT